MPCDIVSIGKIVFNYLIDKRLKLIFKSEYFFKQACMAIQSRKIQIIYFHVLVYAFLISPTANFYPPVGWPSKHACRKAVSCPIR